MDLIQHQLQSASLVAHQLIADGDSQLTAWKLARNAKRCLEVPDFDDRFVVRPPHWMGGHFHALNQYSRCSLCQLTNGDRHCHFRISAEQQPSTEQLGANCVADPFWLTALASDPSWFQPTSLAGGKLDRVPCKFRVHK